MKNLNFGARGWLLLVYQFIAYITYTVFTNWPMNVLADLYGGATTLSKMYTIGAVIAIIIQLILAQCMGKIKSMKWLGGFFGIVTMISAFGVMAINPFMGNMMLWKVCYQIVCIFAPMWATYSVGVLVGQWFPTKKGSFMGIATLAFPIVNGLIGAFAGVVFGSGQMPAIMTGFMPYFIISVIGLLIGLFFIKDYPEQCGAYRDNNKDMTPEVAKAMMEADIENKKKSVWKLAGCFTSKDYWCATLPSGFMLMFSVGTMTQTNSIIGSYGADMDKFGGFAGVMLLIMIFGIVGSLVLGFVDQGIGTKKSMIVASAIMLVSGILGMMNNATCTVLALVLLAIFMGASSNYTVSVCAQYWRREDFSSMFSALNPVANLMSAIGPTIIAIQMVTRGTFGVFQVIMVAGILSVILMFVFSPKNVKKVDDKRREKAGLPLDDALVGRK